MPEEDYNYVLKLHNWKTLLIKKLEKRIEHILTSENIYPTASELELVRQWIEWLEDAE